MFRIGYLVAVGALAVSATTWATAQKKSGSETSLLGVTLYDTGVKVISLYGTPDEVDPVNIGTTSVGGGGGAPGGPGVPGGGPMPGGPRGVGAPSPGGAPGNPGADIDQPDPYGFDFGNSILRQGMGIPPGKGGGARPGVAGGPGAGAPAGLGGPGGGPGLPGGPGGAAGQSQKVIFTRWIYKRAGCKYGFVFDKFNRVVQIEAIGLQNGRVHTKRGIGFGSTFGTIIKKYAKNPDGSANAPDGYEISGDTLVVRYLVKNKVAFRLSRLGKDKPQVVTGIAVAAGKY